MFVFLQVVHVYINWENKPTSVQRLQLVWFTIFSLTAGLVHNDHDDC